MIPLLKCSKCSAMKPPTAFYKVARNKNRQQRHSWCKVCHRKGSAHWDSANPDRKANSHLKRMYGKTLVDKQLQYESQKGICALCEKPLPSILSECEWDHDHDTGQMRDLLHGRCNKFVGVVESSLHEKAIAYVCKHKGGTL